MTFEIVKYPNPILREKCADVIIGDDAIPNTITKMVRTMKDSGGIGLAAPQVGLAIRLAIVDVRNVKTPFSWIKVNGNNCDPKRFQPLVLINPIIKEYGAVSKINEGCLSIDNVNAFVSRPSIVSVEALDKNFQLINFECGGMLARCIQHEVDHLNGVLFTDHIK